MINRQQPPETFDIEKFLLQKPQNEQLSNGVSVFQFINPLLDLIHFKIQINAGSVNESKKLVSSSCFNLLKESHPVKTGSEMDEILDFYGASWSVSTNMTNVSIQWIIPKSNCASLIPILMEIILNPTFKKDPFDRYQQRKIKDLEYNELKYNYRATQLMFHSFFKEHTPSASILTKEHIHDVTIPDIENYYRDTFNASNVTVFVAGNIDQQITSLIRSSFERINNGTPAQVVSTLRDKLNPAITVDEQSNPLQSSIIISKKGFSYHHEERRTFSILSTLLGGYFGSRLMQNLREKSGFTYSVNCGSVYLKDESIFYIESDVIVDKTKQSVEQCFFEMERLKNETISENELQIVRRYLQGMLLRDMDGVVSLMKKYSFWHHFGMDENEIDKTILTLSKVNSEALIKCAKKHLQNEDFYTIIVGKL